MAPNISTRDDSMNNIILPMIDRDKPEAVAIASW